MEEWKYSFDTVTKGEWLDQIKKDLKGKALATLQSEWWPGKLIDPLHHKEDVPEKVVLPGHYFITPPLIMEWINTSSKDDLAIKQQVMNALQFGAQSIVFENKNSSITSWLEGVYTDMVDISLHVSGRDAISRPAILKDIPSAVKIRLHRAKDISFESLRVTLDSLVTNGFDYRVEYPISQKENWFDELIELFHSILTDTANLSDTQSKVDYLGRCVISFESGGSILKQIIQLRVVQLVWLNIFEDFQGNSTPVSPIEFHIKGNTDTTPDKFLITSSATALAASMTGVNAICIHHPEGADIPAYYERVNRNIHHLLHLESQMYRGMDPLAGAYTIDFYSKKWTEEIVGKLTISK